MMTTTQLHALLANVKADILAQVNAEVKKEMQTELADLKADITAARENLREIIDVLPVMIRNGVRDAREFLDDGLQAQHDAADLVLVLNARILESNKALQEERADMIAEIHALKEENKVMRVRIAEIEMPPKTQKKGNQKKKKYPKRDGTEIVTQKRIDLLFEITKAQEENTKGQGDDIKWLNDRINQLSKTVDAVWSNAQAQGERVGAIFDHVVGLSNKLNAMEADAVNSNGVIGCLDHTIQRHQELLKHVVASLQPISHDWPHFVDKIKSIEHMVIPDFRNVLTELSTWAHTHQQALQDIHFRAASVTQSFDTRILKLVSPLFFMFC